MASLKQAIVLGDGDLAKQIIIDSTGNKLAGEAMVNIHNKLQKLHGFRKMRPERRKQIEASISALASKLKITRDDPTIVSLENKIMALNKEGC